MINMDPRKMGQLLMNLKPNMQAPQMQAQAGALRGAQGGVSQMPQSSNVPMPDAAAIAKLFPMHGLGMGQQQSGMNYMPWLNGMSGG